MYETMCKIDKVDAFMDLCSYLDKIYKHIHIELY